MNIDIQNYSLIRNSIYCGVNVPTVTDGKFSTPADRRQVKRWVSGKNAPTNSRLKRLPCSLPDDLQSILKRELFDHGGSYRFEVRTCLNYLAFTEGLSGFNDIFFPILAFHIDIKGAALLGHHESGPSLDIVLPEPYQSLLLEWCSFDDKQREESPTREYHLRVESILLFIAIVEAGLDPQNRLILRTAKWLSENRRRKPERYSEAFFARNQSRYRIWKELARRACLRKKPELKKPTVDDLQACYERRTFYAKLTQPKYDRKFLSEVFGVYCDLISTRSEDKDERETFIRFLHITLYQMHSLDWILKQAPKNEPKLSNQEIVSRLEAYMDFALKVKNLPEFAPEILNAFHQQATEMVEKENRC